MDEHPQIPSLKDAKKKEERKGAGGAFPMRLRGLQAGSTLMERLKQFKKKDLAFILAGLCVLFMAPLAEHFMMSPEGGDASLRPGWGGKDAAGIFGAGGSPYEPGSSGLATGSTVGGGSDLITPLNARDPSALVFGPGATQQPPAGSVAPQTPPPTAPAHSDSELKDALAASARGIGAAAGRASLPVPKVALGGSALRGLGVANGASSATAGLGAVSSNGITSNKADTGGGGLNNVRATSNYKGVARGPTQGGSGIEALQKAAAAAGAAMNQGPAAAALDAAASQAIPNGGSGFGGNGAGGSAGGDKANGADQDKSSKSVGESLDFLKQKAVQEAKIALWAKELEAKDNMLELYKIRNSIAEAIGTSIGSAAGDGIKCMFTKGPVSCLTSSSGPSVYICRNPTDSNKQDTIPASRVAEDSDHCHVDATKDTSNPAQHDYYYDGHTLQYCSEAGSHAVDYSNSVCTPDAPIDKKDNGNAPPPNSATRVGGLTTDEQTSLNGIIDICKSINSLQSDHQGQKSFGDASKAWLTKRLGEAQQIYSAGMALSKQPAGNDCGSPSPQVPRSVYDLQQDALKALKSEAQDFQGVFPYVSQIVKADKPDPKYSPPSIQIVNTPLGQAQTILDALYIPTLGSDGIPTTTDDGRLASLSSNDQAKAAAAAIVKGINNARVSVDSTKEDRRLEQKILRMAAGQAADIVGGRAQPGTEPDDVTEVSNRKKPVTDAITHAQTVVSGPPPSNTSVDDPAAKGTLVQVMDLWVQYEGLVQTADRWGVKPGGTSATGTAPAPPVASTGNQPTNLKQALDIVAKTSGDPAAKKNAQTLLDQSDQAVQAMRTKQADWAAMPINNELSRYNIDVPAQAAQ